MSLSIKSNGSFAFMGIVASLQAEAARATALDNLFTELEQSMFAALYAKRYASVPMGNHRQDIMDRSTVRIFASPRAYRRDMAQARLHSTHFAH